MSIKNIFISIALTLSLAMPAFAEPSYEVSQSSIKFEEAVTADMIEKVNSEMLEKKSVQEKVSFRLSKIKDADLEAFVAAYPQATDINISSSEDLTSIAPLAKLKNLKNLRLNAEKVTDLSALSELTALELIIADYNAEGKDLKWMTKLNKLNTVELVATGLTSLEGIVSSQTIKKIKIEAAILANLDLMVNAMPNIEVLNIRYSKVDDLSSVQALANLKELNAYGASIKDFSPLAGNPKLETISYYAVKDADFSSLGKLKQIKTFDGGLTSLASIDWLQDMPNLKSIDFFAEYVTDYTPLKNAPNLEKLKFWSMRTPLGDLAFLATLPNLKELTIDSMEGVTNFEALALAQKLEDITLRDINEKDKTSAALTSLAKLPNMKDIYIDGAYIENIDVKGLQLLHSLVISEANMGENQNALDLSNVKDLPELRKLDLSESNVTNFNALSNMPILSTLNLTKTKGITDLSNLKAFPKLTSLTVSKDAFTEEQLAVLPETVKITQR